LRRRDFLGPFYGVAAIWPLAVRAQRRTARIGILLTGRAAAANELNIVSELARIGYLNRRDVIFEIRAADGEFSRLRTLARELVLMKPDVLISASAPAGKALAAATQSIPIVLTVTADPIAIGLTDNMSRPSRNVTGFTSSTPTLSAKRLELLRELIPGLQKIAYLGASEGSDFEIFERQVHGAAKALSITVVFVPVTSIDSVSNSFIVVDREKVQAVMVGVSVTNVQASGRIIDECLVRDLPAIHPWSFEVRSGALMSYGPMSLENNAGAARYVDRLLKGAKVAELPFEEPIKFMLAINLRTARTINIVVPPTLLVRADEAIE
jgi:putative ABC transport system substrate-binding protein